MVRSFGLTTLRVYIEIGIAVFWLLHSVVPMAAASTDTLVRPRPTYIVDVWDTEKGLPQNEVTTILQSHNGYLWLGTLNGLVRFDGFRSTVFDESNTPGLTSSRIVSLFEDRQGNLWVGTDTAGIALFRDGRAIPVSLGSSDRPGRLVAACQDPQNGIWLYTAQGQLWHLDHQSTNLFSPSADRSSDYHGVIAEKNGQIWVGMGWRVFAVNTNSILKAPNLTAAQNGSGVKLDLAVGKLDFLLSRRGGGYWVLADGRVRRFGPGDTEPEVEWAYYPWLEYRVSVSAACEDAAGNLIVGTTGHGLFWYDALGHATCISTNEGLSNNYVLSLFTDREANLWVGTDGGGLNRIKRPVFDVLEESRGRVVRSVASDAAGQLWIAYEGFPLTSWEGATQRTYRPYAKTLLIDHRHRLWAGWAGTWGGGVWVKDDQEIHPLIETKDWAVNALHEDREGRIWVGTEHDLACWDEKEWKVYTSQQGLTDAVQAIADDALGNIWVATRSSGLFKLRDGRFTAIRKSPNGLPSDRLWCLHLDTNQVLWIGTDGAGLARFERGRWTRFTRKEGLVSNSIGYIIDDENGYFWLGSNAGLMRVSQQSLDDFVKGATNLIPCRVYGRADGLPIGECTAGSQPAACRTSEGRLCFPTIQGLITVDPAQLQPNLAPPPVIVELVLVDGQPRAETHSSESAIPTISVSAGKERLEIQFTSLNLSAPERARFRYWLQGHETGWTEAGQTRIARYSNLSPGHYQFHVTACNEDGVWNPVGTTLAVIVFPPFWRTWWFLTIVALSFLGATSGVVHFISTQKLQRQLAVARQRETLERERSRIARDIHDQLGANLTQVALLGELLESDKDEPNEVELHARQISQTARDTTRVLDEIVWAVNPSNDTLDGLMTYICKNAQEYLAVAGLPCRLDFPDLLPSTTIPPEVRHNIFLACKESITNIVRHARATEVRLHLQVKRDAFVLRIEDNGQGPPQAEAKIQDRNGLRNISQRMESVGGTFEFGPLPGGGMFVCLMAPLQTQSI